MSNVCKSFYFIGQILFVRMWKFRRKAVPLFSCKWDTVPMQVAPHYLGKNHSFIPFTERLRAVSSIDFIGTANSR